MDDKESFINNHETAPLIELDDFCCPLGSNSFYFRTYDDKKIRIALWNLQSKKGTIILQSGRTEFIEKYYEFMVIYQPTQIQSEIGTVKFSKID